MLIPPKYSLSSKIVELLSSIEASREVINSVDIPPEIENNIRRQSTLRSSLFSARIEGNTLTIDTLMNAPSKDQKRAEVQNILRSLEWIYQHAPKDLTEKEVLTLHSIAMKGLVEPDNLGLFRNNMEAIFNSAGIAIYMPPPPRLIHSLIGRLLRFVNSDKEPIVPIRAALAHFTFEKVHPFLDGSGRVGRLVMIKILWQGGYGMKGLMTLEEYLDEHRALYYKSLEEPEKDASDYLTFILEAIAASAEKAKKQVLAKKTLQTEDYLLPRRAEIYRIIKDHKLVNFDQIRRRFRGVNERTLRYDIKKLQDSRLIHKRGTTNGVYYEASQPPESSNVAEMFE